MTTEGDEFADIYNALIEEIGKQKESNATRPGTFNRGVLAGLRKAKKVIDDQLQLLKNIS